MKIVVLLPGVAVGPTGGYKVILEYANRLVADGHRVTVCYAGSIFFRRKPLRYKLSGIYRYVERYIKGFSYRRWMSLDPRVKERLTFSLNYCHVPHGADRYIATSPYTAWYLDRYPVDAADKFYFIQDREDWGEGLRAIVDDTYHMALNKIVISGWLGDMLRFRYAEMSELVPNSFDFEYFRMSVPVETRREPVVACMWHDMARKDFPTAMEALRIVKESIPALTVRMFGYAPRPSDLPDWVDYTSRPSREEHNAIYNSAKVFLATSRQEGWGLTVGEAMICGAAMVCTDCGGYMEMARDEENAIVAPVGDAGALAAGVIRLLRDDTLRIRLARQAAEDIAAFTPERSYTLFKNALKL